jgi:hypothetical protein
MTPVKCNLCHASLQHYQQQQLQDVGTKVPIPRSTFTNKVAQILTAAEEEVFHGSVTDVVERR